eukprot:scaffold4676_cov94-Isochrysis_galbana.AAC.2
MKHQRPQPSIKRTDDGRGEGGVAAREAIAVEQQQEKVTTSGSAAAGASVNRFATRLGRRRACGRRAVGLIHSLQLGLAQPHNSPARARPLVAEAARAGQRRANPRRRLARRAGRRHSHRHRQELDCGAVQYLQLPGELLRAGVGMRKVDARPASAKR